MEQARFEKSGSADLARRMAAQAGSTRQTIAELQQRYDAERDPMMKSSLGQQINFERLRKAHIDGRI
jgi:plasmid maintenance system antidote protein VapI